MNVSGLKEKIAEAISKHVSIEDTYTYDLKRTKSAFEVGTMSLEDFEEWTDENVDDLAKEIVDALQPQLNENQQIVLDLLKIWQEKWPSWSVSTVIKYLLEQQNEYHQMLSNQEEAQVLQTFSQWVLEQEEE